MLHLQLTLISAVAIAILATVFAISSSFSIYSADTPHEDSRKSISNSGINDSTRTASVVNTPHGLYQTTGDILDPTSQIIGEGDKIVIDPMKYLRTFNYGHVSTF